MIAVIVCNKFRKIGKNETDFGIMNKLAKGNQNIKANINRVISAENVDSVLQNKVLREGLIKIFNSKDFYNKTLF